MSALHSDLSMVLQARERETVRLPPGCASDTRHAPVAVLIVGLPEVIGALAAQNCLGQSRGAVGGSHEVVSQRGANGDPAGCYNRGLVLLKIHVLCAYKCAAQRSTA